jgi:DNA-binding CsgD family transcriptional regulator
MPGSRTAAQARIAALGASALDATELRRQVLDVVREVIEFDAYVWLLTDPVTAVGAAPLAEVPCLPELPALIKFKYATPVNRWTTLQRGPSPVGLLAEEVGGDLAQSLVWRQVMSRYAVTDVASVVFADQFGCWGFLDLWRVDASQFDPAEAAFLAALAPPLTAALRGVQARTFGQPAKGLRDGLGPVVFTLDDDLRITSRTAASQAWLDQLLPPRPDERSVPSSVYNVAAQLLSAEAGVDDHEPFARVHLADGFWLALRAARLPTDEQAPTDTPTPAGSSSIVVTIEVASASERLELFGRAFGLTAREVELLRLLAVGSATRAIARTMSVTEHTVQDHLKAIFGKTGARDRITVLSKALGTRGSDALEG